MSLLVLNSLQNINTALPKSSSNSINADETELSKYLKFDDDLESDFFITESEFKVFVFFPKICVLFSDVPDSLSGSGSGRILI